MTELDKDPADRRPVHRDDGVATVIDRTAPDLEAPNYATTDVDPTPGSPRPYATVEPNFATTDVEPTPGSPRPYATVEPNFATTDVDPTPGSPRPNATVEPNFATTDVDPTPGNAPGHDVRGVSGSVVADPAEDTGRPVTGSPRGR